MRSPRPRGDHGIDPTPKSCTARLGGSNPATITIHLQGREHLALLFSVDEAVLVLHRDERCEGIVDGIVCKR